MKHTKPTQENTCNMIYSFRIFTRDMRIQVKKIIKNQYLKENNQNGSRMDEVSWNVKLNASCKQGKNEYLTPGHIRMKLKHNKNKKNKWWIYDRKYAADLHHQWLHLQSKECK